jgi:acyl-CoA thioester hydrolase
MSAMDFRHLHRVTYAECALGNHIYYGRYLDLLEAARGEFFRHLGSPLLYWQVREVIFPVIECRLRYKAPARYDDCLTIEVWPIQLEKVRIGFAYRIVNQVDVLILEAETFHVCSGLNEKLKRLPDELKEKLRPYLRMNGSSGTPDSSKD